MKRFIATMLTVLLAVPLFAQSTFAQTTTTDDHAKTKKGAAIGAAAGAIVGAVIGNNRGHHSSKRGAVVGISSSEPSLSSGINSLPSFLKRVSAMNAMSTSSATAGIFQRR